METGEPFEIESTQPTRDGLKEFIASPELRGVLCVGEAFLDALREAGWKPSRDAEAKGGR